MFKTKLVEVVNSGRAWAFLGSGPTVDAGGPTWEGLVKRVLDLVPSDQRKRILQDSRFKDARKSKHWDKCFSRIEATVTRPVLEGYVDTILRETGQPGKLLEHLADLPFQGYITTNYDLLLEAALRAKQQSGWTTVGNVGDELRKIAVSRTRVVWHLHGFLGGPPTKSRMVLSEEDYEELYLEDTPLGNRLRELLIHAPVVFFGFGFQDFEVNRVLKRAGKLASPEHPLFGFLGGIDGPEKAGARDELLLKFNLDVVPYHVHEGSHEALEKVLGFYESFILRRSLQFGQPVRACPSFDPETTGLLLYNQLSLRRSARLPADALRGVLRARLLALLRFKGPQRAADLVEELKARIAVLRRADGPIGTSKDELQTALSDLLREGLVRLSVKETPECYALTEKAEELVSQQVANSELLTGQFEESIRSRALQLTGNNGEQGERVTAAAEAFIRDCVQTRALGVALALQDRGDYQSYHTVALLQSLPRFISSLGGQEEALALVRLVQALLASPSEAERTYIGALLQAVFAVHLLGYDPNSLGARMESLTDALFLVDASLLIPYLARSSVGHQPAQELIRRLHAIGCKVASTSDLAEEVAEHGRYALKHVSKDDGTADVNTLRAATGRGGGRSNAFLEGFLAERARGTIHLGLRSYFEEACGVRVPKDRCSREHVKQALASHGIPCLMFEEWEGFYQELFAERDELSKRIAERRLRLGTYTHDRQTKAEAEALLIVRNLRTGHLQLSSRYENAYFVSHSRVIDDVERPGRRITMRPDAVLQWLTTLSPCSPDELGFLMDRLLWELADSGFKVVDERTLRTVFGPLIDASRDNLEPLKAENRELMTEILGEDPRNAFRDLSDLEVPIVEESIHAQRAAELERRLALEQKRADRAVERASLSDKERKELEDHRAKDRARKKKVEKKRRAAQARKPRKKKR